MSKQKIRSIHDKRLMCRFSAWRVIDAGVLALEMPEHNCCDMTSAIEIGRVVMPGVRVIATFAGGFLDTEYRLISGEWHAFRHDAEVVRSKP